MNHSVQNLLKKINYIEADIEIQKQILFSIPTSDEKELERVIQIIADKKEEITSLRLEIQQIDPEEYEKILLFENAVEAFKKLASEKNFTSIDSMNINEECTLLLKDKGKTACLIKAREENGDYTIITMDGEIQHFASDTVIEETLDSPPISPN